jgi:hypothetical protein
LLFFVCAQASSSPIAFLFLSSSSAFFNLALSSSTSSPSAGLLPYVGISLSLSLLPFLPEARSSACCSAKDFLALASLRAASPSASIRRRSDAVSRRAMTDDEVVAALPASPVQYEPETTVISVCDIQVSVKAY